MRELRAATGELNGRVWDGELPVLTSPIVALLQETFPAAAPGIGASPGARPRGCPFAGRCPRYLGSVCDDVAPPVRDAGNGHTIACHLPLRDLAPPATAPPASV